MAQCVFCFLKGTTVLQTLNLWPKKLLSVMKDGSHGSKTKDGSYKLDRTEEPLQWKDNETFILLNKYFQTGSQDLSGGWLPHKTGENNASSCFGWAMADSLFCRNTTFIFLAKMWMLSLCLEPLHCAIGNYFRMISWGKNIAYWQLKKACAKKKKKKIEFCNYFHGTARERVENTERSRLLCADGAVARHSFALTFFAKKPPCSISSTFHLWLLVCISCCATYEHGAMIFVSIINCWWALPGHSSA